MKQGTSKEHHQFNGPIIFTQEEFVELNSIVPNIHTTIYLDGIPTDNQTSELIWKEPPSDIYPTLKSMESNTAKHQYTTPGLGLGLISLCRRTKSIDPLCVPLSKQTGSILQTRRIGLRDRLHQKRCPWWDLEVLPPLQALHGYETDVDDFYRVGLIHLEYSQLLHTRWRREGTYYVPSWFPKGHTSGDEFNPAN